ncbi:MAG: TPM domain-containing protein [Sporomusaceae bacterium]|nr:TPM domain-containing protein [Sporomusaceae bacterium]
MGSALETKTKARLVAVTVNTLNGRTIEEYALDLMRRWGIGDKTAKTTVWERCKW